MPAKLLLADLFKTHRYATIAFSAALLGVLAGIPVAWSGKARGYFGPAQVSEPRINSKAPALRVLGTSRTSLGDHSALVVKLQNISDKPIKAYIIAGGKAWVTKHYYFEDHSIAPNAVENGFIPLSSKASQDTAAFGSSNELTIAAVFFADGSGQGDPVFVTRFTDELAAMRDQANRILPCLQLLAASLVAQGESAVVTCEAEALRLPVKSPERSSDYEKGLKNSQTVLLTQLKEIKDGMHANNLSEALHRREKVTRVFQALAHFP